MLLNQIELRIKKIEGLLKENIKPAKKKYVKSNEILPDKY